MFEPNRGNVIVHRIAGAPLSRCLWPGTADRLLWDDASTFSRSARPRRGTQVAAPNWAGPRRSDRALAANAPAPAPAPAGATLHRPSLKLRCRAVCHAGATGLGHHRPRGQGAPSVGHRMLQLLASWVAQCPSSVSSALSQVIRSIAGNGLRQLVDLPPGRSAADLLRERPCTSGSTGRSFLSRTEKRG